MREDEKRPRNLKANLLPTEGYGLEVDGRVKAQYDTAEAAAKAGLELKQKYPLFRSACSTPRRGPELWSHCRYSQ